jgi:hypothetical protein
VKRLDADEHWNNSKRIKKNYLELNLDFPGRRTFCRETPTDDHRIAKTFVAICFVACF